MHNRCNFCGGPFGMVRHRWWRQQFCSKRCYNLAQTQRDRLRQFLKNHVKVPRVT